MDNFLETFSKVSLAIVPDSQKEHRLVRFFVTDITPRGFNIRFEPMLRSIPEKCNSHVSYCDF